MTPEAKIARLEAMASAKPNMRLKSALFEIRKAEVTEILRGKPAQITNTDPILKRMAGCLSTIAGALK